MKKWLLTLLLGTIALFFFWILSGRSHADRSTEVLADVSQSSVTNRHLRVQAESPDQPEAPSSSAVDPGPISSAAAFKPERPVGQNVAPVPRELTGIEPATVIENMRTTIRQYGAMFGGNPVGSNPEITSALQGQNPKGINFLKADGNRVNDQGELVDAWGTPYFFHQLSGTETEIRSAGPDQIMYTADDLVIK